MKQQIKIKLEGEDQLKQAWDALIKLGYECVEYIVPNTLTPYFYLYAQSNGVVRLVCDEGGADSFNHHSPWTNFYTEKEHEPIALANLKLMAYGEDECIFAGIDPEYIYYSVDADGEAWYTKDEPRISNRGDYWGKDISMKEAPNFNFHSDWKKSLILRS